MSQQALASKRPLIFILNPSGDAVAEAGKPFELRVTVSNQGGQSALIDVYIDFIKYLEQNRELGRILGELPPRERLALTSGQSSEVIFKIDIPKDAIPGFYEYLLVLDAPQHYPEETPIQHSGQLQVQPFVQGTRTVSDPTFYLEPVSSSAKPIGLQPGEKLELKVKTYNRSERVDRFRLACPDLPENWSLQVIYPESLSKGGLVVAADGLELNPGQEGEITLELTSAVDSLAGIYSPTIRLYSDDDPSLVLLDVFYIQINGIYQLDVDMLTRLGKVHRQAGLFELHLHNQGNTVREVKLQAESADADNSCTYTLDPEQLRLLPKEQKTVRLAVQPPQAWWQRSFYGKQFNFIVEVEDVQSLPLTNNRFIGTLIWEGRPWWQFLLLGLIILGAIAGTWFLVWWLLFRPKPVPEIVEFYPESFVYKEVNNDAVRLNWQISTPQDLKSIKVVGLSPEGVITSSPIIYDFSKGIPNQLKDNCTMRQLLNCQSVYTDARKPGNYIFELTITHQQGKQAIVKSLKTNTISIAPIPQPKIIAFTPTQPVYEEKPTVNAGKAISKVTNTVVQSSNNGILLNWEISNPEQIQELRLIARSPDGAVNYPQKIYDFTDGIPLGLKNNCPAGLLLPEILKCRNVPTGEVRSGDYVFELTVISKTKKQEPFEFKKTDLVKIKPLPTKIVDFKIQGTQAQAKYRLKMAPDKPLPVIISWKITGSKNLKVELLPSPGTVDREGILAYPLSPENGKETLTLQATNEAGQTVSRSVVIETYVPEVKLENKANIVPPGTVPTFNNPSGNNPNSPNGGLPPVPPPLAGSTTTQPGGGNQPGVISPARIPEENNSLPPVELPPQTQ